MNFQDSRAILAVLSLLLAASTIDSAEPKPDPNELPRIAHVPPDKALETFQLKSGFKLRQAAAELRVYHYGSATRDQLTTRLLRRLRRRNAL